MKPSVKIKLGVFFAPLEKNPEGSPPAEDRPKNSLLQKSASASSRGRAKKNQRAKKSGALTSEARLMEDRPAARLRAFSAAPGADHLKRGRPSELCRESTPKSEDRGQRQNRSHEERERPRREGEREAEAVNTHSSHRPKEGHKIPVASHLCGPFWRLNRAPLVPE